VSDKLFINNPKNIRKEMLNPTASTNFSVEPILFNFKIWRINKPGKMVRKKNPKICLKKGVFKSIATSVAIRNTSMRKKYLLVPEVFDNSII
jgi:hypothetical protein